MKKNRRIGLYILLILVMAITCYLIFNSGNPDSLLRYLIKERQYDFLITLFFSLGVLVLSSVLIGKQDKSPLRKMLKENTEHVSQLRSQGETESQIADSFLKELGYQPGLLQKLAKKQVLRYLKEIT